MPSHMETVLNHWEDIPFTSPDEGPQLYDVMYTGFRGQVLTSQVIKELVELLRMVTPGVVAWSHGDIDICAANAQEVRAVHALLIVLDHESSFRYAIRPLIGSNKKLLEAES